MSTETITELRARWAGMIPVAEADGERGMAQEYAAGVKAIDDAGGDARLAATLLRADRPGAILAADLDELAAKRTHRYFISYATVPGLGYGNSDLTRIDPIRTLDDINEVAAAIRQHNGLDDNVVVLNWQRFEAPAETAGV